MFNPAELQAAGNAPEVHAAVIQASTQLLLSTEFDRSRMSGQDAASSIAMNAAMILRNYLEFLGARSCRIRRTPSTPNQSLNPTGKRPTS